VGPACSALLPHFRVLRYDLPGQDASDAPPGITPWSASAAKARPLREALDNSRFAFLRLSLGGMIGPGAWPNALIARASRARQHVSLLADPRPMEQRRQTVFGEAWPP